MYSGFVAITKEGELIDGNVALFTNSKYKQEVIDYLLNEKGAVYGYVYTVNRMVGPCDHVTKTFFGDESYKELFEAALAKD